MFARIGAMRAMNRHVERVFNPDRKDHHWGKRKHRLQGSPFAEKNPSSFGALRIDTIVMRRHCIQGAIL